MNDRIERSGPVIEDYESVEGARSAYRRHLDRSDHLRNLSFFAGLLALISLLAITLMS